MLSICKVALGQEEYYLATAGAGREHSVGLVEAPGVWLGAAVLRRGLPGVAEPPAVRMLFAGVDPASGEPLLEEPARRRVAAYDCTFSTPKSVSLTQALSPDPEARKQMRLGHEAAVTASLAYLETEAPAIRMTTPDGPRVVRGGDVVGVGFLHRLSRAGDPHLHTHVLIANVVVDPTGGPGHPLDATSLFLEISTARALYETHLRFELTQRLGVEWQPLNGRCWSDLKGLDRPAIEKLSRRSSQIADAVRAEGWQGPAAYRAMADWTRPPKDTSRPYADVIEDCRLRLREAGVSDTRLVNVCHRVEAAGAPELSDERRHGDSLRSETLRHLGTRSVDGTFTTRDVIRAVCATEREGRSVDGVLQDAREALTDERVVARQERSLWLRGGATGSVPVGRSEASFTTLDIAATEHRIAVLARSMAGERPDALTVVGYGAGDRFAALDALSLAAASWRADGRSVLAVAPGRWSAAGIESASGIDAVVLPPALLAAHIGAGARIAPSAVEDLRFSSEPVVVLGEAQCYGPAVLEGLLRSCESAGASLVLLGPRWALETRPALAAVTTLAAELPEPALSSRTLDGAALPTQRFGDVAVTMAPSLATARDEAVRQLAAVREGACDVNAKAAIVVTGDEAITKALRAMPGVGAHEIVHTRDLKRVLGERAAAGDRSGAAPRLVVLGGASVLRQGATAAPGTNRSHVVVAPGLTAGSPAGLGRAAEAARPRYLTSCLGTPPDGPVQRQVWREAAASIERYRDRWEIIDDRHAYGRSAPAAERCSEREMEQAAVALRAVEVRAVSPQRRARGHGAPEVGLGR